MSYVALIAGAGSMPVRIMEEIKAMGQRVLLIAIHGVTPIEMQKYADLTHWGYLTQVGRARRICQKYRAKKILMAGLIRHNNIFKLPFYKLDFTTIRALLTVKDYRADTICTKIIEVFQKKGIEFVSTTKILNKYLAPLGNLSKTKPSKKVQQDIVFGKSIALELGRLDIGQLVVVKNKSIVAVEAMEGTDQCLQRAGDLAGEGCVAIKLPKPNQDTRFDVPVIGINTIEKLAKIKASAIAIGAQKTFIIDPDVLELANHHKISIVSIEV